MALIIIIIIIIKIIIIRQLGASAAFRCLSEV